MERTLEWPIRARAFISKECIGFLQGRAVPKKCPDAAKRPKLYAGCELIRQTFYQSDVHNTQTRKVSVFCTERTIQDVYVLNQLRCESFQRAQVSLTMTLRSLVLLHIVDEDFQTAVNASVVQVETKPSDLERLAATFMLAGIDPGIERFQ